MDVSLELEGKESKTTSRGGVNDTNLRACLLDRLGNTTSHSIQPLFLNDKTYRAVNLMLQNPIVSCSMVRNLVSMVWDCIKFDLASTTTSGTQNRSISFPVIISCYITWLVTRMATCNGLISFLFQSDIFLQQNVSVLPAGRLVRLPNQRHVVVNPIFLSCHTQE